MAIQMQLRRGTTAERMGFVPAEGEPIYDTTEDVLYMGDGATLGGQAVGKIDPGSIGNAQLANGAVTFNKIANGAVGTNQIGNFAVGSNQLSDNAVTQTKVNNAAIGQAELKTSIGSFSRSSSGFLTLPGGAYGFMPALASTLNNFNWSWGGLSPTNTYQLYYNALNGSTGSGSQRYITASPPYDLGDGEVQGFMYMLIEKSSGDVVVSWSADTAPWIYNGVNKATADFFKEDGTPMIRQKPKATLAQVRENRIPQAKDVELTHAIKNKDMATIPHPFGDVNTATHKVILFDPMDHKVGRILAEQNAGNLDLVQDILKSRSFRINNNKLARCAPNGVTCHKIDF